MADYIPSLRERYAKGDLFPDSPSNAGGFDCAAMFGSGAEQFQKENPEQVARLQAYSEAHKQTSTAESLPPAEQKKSRRFFTVDEFGDLPPMDWVLKNLLPRRGVGQLFGESGAGKSFIALDLVWHLAEGRDWFGWKFKHDPAGLPEIFYLCLEGAEGFRLRVKGIKARWYDPQGLPFPSNLHFSFEDFNILDTDEVADLINVVNAKKGGVPPFIVVDTQAQASPAMDVSGSELMMKILGATEYIAKAVDGFVLLIAHAPKVSDPTKGAIGSIMQKAPCATQIAVCKNQDKTRTVHAAKVKDNEDGIKHDFQLVSIQLGEDEDGDPITTCTVEQVASAKRKSLKLSQNEKLAVECFKEAQAGRSCPITDEEWRVVYFQRSTYSSKDSKRTMFGNAKKSLQEKGRLLCSDNVYTLRSEPETEQTC